MKRALAVLLASMLVAAGCGGSSSGSSGGGSSQTNMSAAELLAASRAAAAKATSAAFEVTIHLNLDGNLQGAGTASAFLQGPLSLSLKGEAGRASGSAATGKFDIHFAINFTGGSLQGEALSPDGNTAYVQMPTLLGPGWKSIDISKGSSTAGGSSESQGLDELKALGLDPSTWLANESVSSGGGADTISADLDVAKLVADLASASGSRVTAKDQKQLDEIPAAVKAAHASESFDQSSHLPTALSFELAFDVPSDLQRESNGLTGLDLKVDAAFSDWNKDFSVPTPSGATPFDSSGLFGGLSSGV